VTNSEGILILPKRIPNNSGIKIGRNTRIGLGTVIGSDGFGFETLPDGSLVRKPHNFGVVIGDDVEIGSNCNIDKGRWRDTVIGNGTKIDAFVHIAHNVVIGNHCIIGAGARILGSVTIGDGSIIWSGAVINQGVIIGNNSVIGACSYLRHTVGNDETWYGVPAQRMK
jgi:UDP-3-O-[3-hydroxymyristoyl] glucosamine N-acyltransferase